MDLFTADAYATYPLTLFDRLFQRTTFLTGWLIEGTVDADALSKALTSVTQKWRMLAGRLESIANEENVVEWRIRIPLQQIPTDYKTFELTTKTSEWPLSHYVQLPLPLVSSSLPHSLFIHPTTPRQYTSWESQNHPLTCWHITYLPADPSNGGKQHTCLGFARSHGIFDGNGASAVMHALVAEMKGQEWPVPPLPSSGYNNNPVQTTLNAQIQAHNAQGGAAPENYYGFVNLGATGALKMVAWHMRERWWSGADRRTLLLPKDVLSTLVNSVRTEPNHAHQKRPSADASTGDILVAWVLKTMYSSGASPTSTIQCLNLASFRGLLSEDDATIIHYPHNAFVPLPYPTMTVDELQKHSLKELSRTLAVSRNSLSIKHLVPSYDALKSVTAFPANPNANENVLISNVSASRILESDWSPVGGKRTICGYRYQLTPNEVLWTNSVFIAGRLDDGSVVLDLSLNKARTDLLAKAVVELVALGVKNRN